MDSVPIDGITDRGGGVADYPADPDGSKRISSSRSGLHLIQGQLDPKKDRFACAKVNEANGFVWRIEVD